MNKKQIKLKFYYTQNKKSQEQLYIIDNKAKKVIFSQTFEIGDIIISIINNYNTIIHILNTYIKKVEKSDSLSMDETFLYMEELKKKLNAKKLNIVSELLDVEFYKISKRTEETIQYDILSNPQYSKFQGNCIVNHYIRKKGFRNDSLINFLTVFTRLLTRMKEYTEVVFDLSDSKNDVNISTELPKVSIEYDKKAKIQSYIYNIDNIKDLFLAVIYDLRLSNKFILKCAYCGNLFIPKTNKKEQRYCYSIDEYGQFTCRNKGRKRMYYYHMKEKNNN